MDMYSPTEHLPIADLTDPLQFPAREKARRVLAEHGIGTREADEAAAEAAAFVREALDKLQDALGRGEPEEATTALAAILEGAIAADLAAPDTAESETAREIAAEAVHTYRTNPTALAVFPSVGSSLLSITLAKEYRAMTARALEQAALLLKRTKRGGGWRLMEHAEWARDEAAVLLQTLQQSA